MLKYVVFWYNMIEYIKYNNNFIANKETGHENMSKMWFCKPR